jgi:cytoskeletal protein CcmA (bactofilin family)
MADPSNLSMAHKQTLVEEGTEFKGSLTSSCPVVVRGKVEGEISTPSLTVSPTGAVHGRAKVGSLSSQGEVAGEFDADTVELSGTVRDKTVIRAKSLEVKLAPANGKLQVVFGECSLDVGDAPVKADAISPAVAAVVAEEPPLGFAVSPSGGGKNKGARSSVRPPSEPAPRQANGEGTSTPPPALPSDDELLR